MNRMKMIQLRKAILQGSESLPDEVASKVPDLFDEWKSDTQYAVDDRRRYGEVLYKCLMAHMSQASWTPDVSPSLWVRTDNPHEEWPEWVQPQGSTDAYKLGDKVTHNSTHWISNTDANVWEPGVYGWDSAD